MGVELRRGRPFLYVRKRVNGRLRGSYGRPLSEAEADFYRARAESVRIGRDADRNEVQRIVKRADAVLLASAEFDRLADRLFRSVMHLCGFKLHHRAEWRKTRGINSMFNLAELFSTGKPRPALIPPVVDDPEKMKVLELAAKGDRSVLPAVMELLKDQQFLTLAGGVARMAEVALIAQAAGDHLAVAHAISVKIDEYQAQLLADCGPTPTYAERMAATRCAHNWVALHIVEFWAARSTPSSAAAIALDKRLTQAERRLHLALRSLATLRRLRRPVRGQTVAMAVVCNSREGAE